MYRVTIVSVSEPSVSVRDNLNRQELLEDYKEWLEDNLNIYSSFFFEEKGTNNSANSAYFFKKTDGTIEKLTGSSAKS